MNGSSATAVNHFDQLNGCKKLAVLKDVAHMFYQIPSMTVALHLSVLSGFVALLHEPSVKY